MFISEGLINLITFKQKYQNRYYLKNRANLLAYAKSRYQQPEIKNRIKESSFDLSNHEQIKLSFSPENLQWLTLTENISKGNKVHFGDFR